MKAATRLTINVIIDVLLLAAMFAVSAIGLLLKYVLIHGSDRWEKYGDNVDLRYWGLDHHDWGYIHWLVSLALLVLIVLHLVFHWKQIICLVKRYLPVAGVRRVLVSLFLLLMVLVGVSPFLWSVEVGEPVRGYRNEAGPGRRAASPEILHDEADAMPGQREEIRRNHDEDQRLMRNRSEKQQSTAAGTRKDGAEHARQAPGDEHHEAGRQHKAHENSLDIQGFHSLAEVAKKYEVPASALQEMLGIPKTVSPHERLGRLRRAYGFSMSDVERCVLKLQQNN